MPELPDVEIFKNYLDATSLHKKITDVKVGNKKVLEGISARKLADTLKGRRLLSTRRHGKYLFVETDDDFWLILHFGMTGYLQYYRQGELPRHTRLLLAFDNGYHLAFICQRMLGRVGLTDSVDAYVESQQLGPDGMTLDYKYFRQALQKSRGIIKSALMKQELVAGIGNIYSDEILFQAGVHPEAKCNQLDEARLKKLYRSIGKVVKTAVAKQADPDKFPRSYLLPHREPGGRCPRCGTEIQNIKAGGRTAYFCPKCQPADG